MPRRKNKIRPRQSFPLAQVLVFGGLALIVITILAFKKKPQSAVPTAVVNAPTVIESAEALLDLALSQKRPTLAFFHSNNCYQCTVMMEIVAQVHSEFSDSVELVDINVYDKNNSALLRRVRLQYIPTLIFYDRSGEEQVSVGVMEASKLRETLANLALGD